MSVPCIADLHFSFLSLLVWLTGWMLDCYTIFSLNYSPLSRHAGIPEFHLGHTSLYTTTIVPLIVTLLLPVTRLFPPSSLPPSLFAHREVSPSFCYCAFICTSHFCYVYCARLIPVLLAQFDFLFPLILFFKSFLRLIQQLPLFSSLVYYPIPYSLVRLYPLFIQYLF